MMILGHVNMFQGPDGRYGKGNGFKQDGYSGTIGGGFEAQSVVRQYLPH